VLEGQGLVELGRKQIDGNNADGEVIPTTWRRASTSTFPPRPRARRGRRPAGRGLIRRLFCCAQCNARIVLSCLFSPIQIMRSIVDGCVTVWGQRQLFSDLACSQIKSLLPLVYLSYSL
jgi:hypothetical protein